MRPDRRRAGRWLRAVAVAAPAILALSTPRTAAAQQNGLLRDPVTALGHRVGRVPFHPGEELKYTLSAGRLGGGDAVMSVGQIARINGHPTLPLAFRIEGRALGGIYKMDDKVYSWMDPARGISLRFVKDQDFGERYREYDFFPEERLVRRRDHDTTWALPSPLPLDDLSFVYFARTLPLEVGDRHTYHRYFKDSGNPITIEVLRKDSVETEAGVFNTVVVQPILPESSLFPPSAKAEIHFSDDDRRLVVYMKVTRYLLPLTLELTEFKMGVPSERSDEEEQPSPIPAAGRAPPVGRR